MKIQTIKIQTIKILAITLISSALFATSCGTTTTSNSETFDVQNSEGVGVDLVLESSSWKLITLLGHKIENDEGTMNFDISTGQVSGKLDCNSYTGTYFLQPNGRIELSNIATTLMACPSPEIERDLLELLNTTDNYTIARGKTQDTLMLHKARTAPLATFVSTNSPRPR